MYYKKHIFICTNQRTAGGRPSCGEQHGLELVAAFKKLIKDRGLSVGMRAQKAGCLDVCELGPSDGVDLYVWNMNTAAIRCYSAVGFKYDIEKHTTLIDKNTSYDIHKMTFTFQ